MATYEKKLVNLGYMPLKYLRLTPKTSKVIQNRKRDIFFSGHGTGGGDVNFGDKNAIFLDWKVGW